MEYSLIFGSALYLYQMMPVALNISPSIWQSYINAILNCLQNKKYCEAIMDDLLLFTPLKISHVAKLENLLKALLKNGLKISPKKGQLFRMKLHYMGNEIFIQNQKSLHSIPKKQIRNNSEITAPTTAKGCISFAGMDNFLSMFCPELQKLLKSI